VQAPGLADLMQTAETAMKEGKYATAIRQYEAAGQVAPNNGMVLVGRATAELGASFYRRADATLREAFTMDPSLMLAQYDLTQLLPEERLQFVVRELKDLANREPTQTTPVFLLAFIAYNTGNEVNAAGFLDQADKRAGGNDPVLKLVREHWSLPGMDEMK
jgi:cytochrome c-type biogenesis protein CcmH/NrfG